MRNKYRNNDLFIDSFFPFKIRLKLLPDSFDKLYLNELVCHHSAPEINNIIFHWLYKWSMVTHNHSSLYHFILNTWNSVLCFFLTVKRDQKVFDNHPIYVFDSIIYLSVHLDLLLDSSCSLLFLAKAKFKPLIFIFCGRLQYKNKDQSTVSVLLHDLLKKVKNPCHCTAKRK